MQNNDFLSELYNEITKAHYILLVTDQGLATQCITSSLALSNYFTENKIKHKVFNVSAQLPRKLNFLSKFDKISKDIPKYYDLVIYIDCTNQYISEIEISKEVKALSINSHVGNISELLYSFFKGNKLEISKNTAECLYVGISHESLGFSAPKIESKVFNMVADLLNSNINISEISDNLIKRESLAKFKTIPKIMNTLELFSEGRLAIVYIDSLWLKETGADINECDDVVDMVLSLGIVKVVVYFKVTANKVAVILQSKSSIDLSSFSRELNATKNKNMIELTLSSSNFIEVKEKLVKTILNYI